MLDLHTVRYFDGDKFSERDFIGNSPVSEERITRVLSAIEVVCAHRAASAGYEARIMIEWAQGHG